MNVGMNIYARALEAYLNRPNAPNQNELAERSGTTQASISRYATGERFPDVETAKRISGATNDEVPLDTWRRVAAERAGLGDLAA
jgi:transcriptional regulator with XRE-family HTH domain